ncbi:hypothetical protein ACVWZM_001551 [Bradyrhizobium sp. USDA 4501]
MPSVLAIGKVEIKSLNREFGIESVPVPTMRKDDQVLLTPHITNGGSGPDRKGPLYCAFIHEKKDGGFEVMAYDIQAGRFDVTIFVDWCVLRA